MKRGKDDPARFPDMILLRLRGDPPGRFGECAMLRLHKACKRPWQIVPPRGGTSGRGDEPVAPGALRRLPPFRGETSVVSVLLAAVMAGSAWLSCGSARAGQGFDRDDPPGAGTIVRSETLHLWLPETLAELRCPRSQLPRDHRGLRRFLERRGRKELHYAVTVRGHQADGGNSDITFIRRPYEDPAHLREFLDILADFGGKPDRDTPAEFRGTPVSIIPEGRLRTSAEVRAELRRVREEEP